MNAKNEKESVEAPAQSTPKTRSEWAWGLATLLLIVLAFTSHELTQTQQQLETSQAELSTGRTATGKAQSLHPDIAKITEALKKYDAASRTKVANLELLLAGIDSRLKDALSEVDELGAAHSHSEALRRELQAARSKLDKAFTELDTHE